MVEIITLVLMLAVVGFILYLVATYIPMPEPFRMTIVVLTVILLILFLLRRLSLGLNLGL